MWKESPRTVRKVVGYIMIAGIVIGVLGAVIEWFAVAAIGVVLMLVALVLHVAFYRCNHCGEFLDRSNGDFWPYCGSKLK